MKGGGSVSSAIFSKVGVGCCYGTCYLYTVPMDQVSNPGTKQYGWVPTGVWTITKPAQQSSVPSIMGNLGDSFVSGVAGDTLKKNVSGGENEAK
ncbi:adenylate cyclase [Escherichia coli]